VNPDFGLYQLAPEHKALREAVRALSEKEIAPPCRRARILRSRAKVLTELSTQISLRMPLRKLIVSAGDLAWTHKRSMTIR
jgi:hypothetical protein